METERITFKVGRSSYVCLALSEIMYLRANGSYTEIITSSSRIYTISKGLKTISEKPKLMNFIRVNRGILLNPMHLNELHTGSRSEVVLNTGETFIPSSSGITLLINYMESHIIPFI